MSGPQRALNLAELRFASRRLRRVPSFTITTVFVLALGVGATTAVFSVVNGVLASATALCEPQPPGRAHAFDRGGGSGLGGPVGCVRLVLSGARESVHRDRRLARSGREPGVGGRPRGHRGACWRGGNHIQFVQRTRSTTAPRPRFPERRGSRGRGAGRDPLVSILAATLQRRPFRDRKANRRERNCARGRRRDAEELRVSALDTGALVPDAARSGEGHCRKLQLSRHRAAARRRDDCECARRPLRMCCPDCWTNFRAAFRGPCGIRRTCARWSRRCSNRSSAMCRRSSGFFSAAWASCSSSRARTSRISFSCGARRASSSSPSAAHSDPESPESWRNA